MVVQAAKRVIKNKALGFLAALKDEEVTQQLLHRFREASNMTDKTAALACLCDSPGGLPALGLGWQRALLRPV